jgi:hypothetical protein
MTQSGRRLGVLSLPRGGSTRWGITSEYPFAFPKSGCCLPAGGDGQGRPAVRQLTDVEVRKFYAAYRALEKKVYRLGRVAPDYHEAAIWRDLLIAALATFLLVLWLLS